MRVLVTRAEPAASRTAAKLESLGFKSIICPFFELHDIGNPSPSISADHYIFTSANAAEILNRRNWKPSNNTSYAWCVGSKTEISAKALGFNKTRTANGGGANLAKLIISSNPTSNDLFVYPTTPDRSFDMAEALSELNVTVETIDLYQTIKIIPDFGKLQEFFARDETAVIFVYSDRSAHHLMDILKNSNIAVKFECISVISISQSAANIMLNCPWQGVYVSQRPNETSMISRLEDV